MSYLDNNFDLLKKRLRSKSLVIDSGDKSEFLVPGNYGSVKSMGVYDNPADELMGAHHLPLRRSLTEN